MQGSRCKLSLSAWSKGLTVRSDAVAQELLHRQNVRSDNGQTVPVRCIVARRFICRGEQLCVIPESHILHGRNAVRVVQHAAGQGSLPSYNALQQHLAAVKGDPCNLSTRDPLLIALAVYLLRYGGAQSPLAEWAACLPPRVPSMGLLLQQGRPGELAPFKPLQRQLRIGGYTSVIPPSGGSSSETTAMSAELLLQAAEEYGIEHVRMPQTEVVASGALMTAFYRNVRCPLTKRQHEAASALHRHVGSAVMQQLSKLEEHLVSSVLVPLLPCVSSTPRDTKKNLDCDDDIDDTTASLVEKLRWSHFMVRSRVICLQPHNLHAPQAAVVPFLDMLNHSARTANVVYRYRPGFGVIVAAARPIKVDEELTLNYGDYKQRGCLFSKRAEYVADRTHAADMRHIESRQMREWDKVSEGEDSEDDRFEEAPFGYGLQQQHMQGGKEESWQDCEKDNEWGETRAEAVWLWRYGFLRSDDEKAYVASRLWSKGLRNRIAQLTDVRRRGRPGEFVIGVPEGLRHLREERGRLERERFGGATVFPPQSI